MLGRLIILAAMAIANAVQRELESGYGTKKDYVPLGVQASPEADIAKTRLYEFVTKAILDDEDTTSFPEELLKSAETTKLAFATLILEASGANNFIVLSEIGASLLSEEDQKAIEEGQDSYNKFLKGTEEDAQKWLSSVKESWAQRTLDSAKKK